MWRHRNSVRRGLLTAAITLAPLTLLALQVAPAHAQGQAPTSRSRQVAQKLAWLGQELQLTDKQKKKARPMIKEMTSQLLAVKGTPGLTAEQQKAKGMVIASNTLMGIRMKVLNKDQQAKYDAIKEQAIQKMLEQRAAQQAAAQAAAEQHAQQAAHHAQKAAEHAAAAQKAAAQAAPSR